MSFFTTEYTEFHGVFFFYSYFFLFALLPSYPSHSEEDLATKGLVYIHLVKAALLDRFFLPSVVRMTRKGRRQNDKKGKIK